MTNAEKYLKEPKIINEFVQELTKVLSRFDGLQFYSYDIETAIFNFLNVEVKGTLTKQERDILQGLPKEWKTISRVNGHIELHDSLPEKDKMIRYIRSTFRNYLFDFIEERRRIFY